MSRFYDALKAAGRSRPTEIPPESDWRVSTTGDGDVPTWNGTAGTEPESSALAREGTPESLHEDLLQLAAVSRHRAMLQNADLSAKAKTPEQDQAGTAEPSDALPKRETLTPPAGTLRPKSEIAFDPRARLIPHAVDSVVVEHYRRLRTKILQQHTTKPFRSLVVASPCPQEGKTVTVLNLGLSFAMLADFKVLVVDGDLRRGTIGKWLGANEYPGLSNLLEGTVQLDEVVLKGADIPMHVMTRGNSRVPPAELLHSPQLVAQFRRMTEHFDLVLVDSSPVTLITDAQLLAGSCDAVLLIARAFSTRRKSLEQAMHDLSAFRVIGTVLNGATQAQPFPRHRRYY
jgi:capsular exopolysaccharide synthesis family protein